MTKAVTRKIRKGSKEEKFINFCETHFFFRGVFPTVDEATEKLNYATSEIHTFLRNVNVQKALERRGLPWKQRPKGELTQEQIATALLVNNFADSRSLDEKLQHLGVLPAQYFAWLDDPEFHGFVNTVVDRSLNKIRPEAITQFSRHISQGNLKAIQYYFEVTGQFKNPEIQNVQALVQRLVESVQKHVKDPEVLAAISRDMLSTVSPTEITTDYNEKEQVAISQLTGGR